jgi:membrane protein implicated in regulation of membrane protease activity
LYDYSLFDQIALFFIVSICAGICLKKWVRRHGNRGNYRSNVHALIGKVGVVVTPHERTNYSVPGYMHIEGQVWAYTSPQDVAIQAGSLVEVIDVRGAHLVVKPVVE